jgi:hypothetical protein
VSHAIDASKRAKTPGSAKEVHPWHRSFKSGCKSVLRVGNNSQRCPSALLLRLRPKSSASAHSRIAAMHCPQRGLLHINLQVQLVTWIWRGRGIMPIRSPYPLGPRGGTVQCMVSGLPATTDFRTSREGYEDAGPCTNNLWGSSNGFRVTRRRVTSSNH